MAEREGTFERRHMPDLHASEERFRKLVDSVQDYAIFMLDAKGYVVSWNTGAQRIKGYAAAEIVGRHFSVFYTAEDLAAGKATRQLARAAELERSEDEGWRVRKDGTRFWANVVITALRDLHGRIDGFVKVTRDISAQRAAAEALRASEAQFRAVAETANDAVISAGQDGRIFYFNPAAERIFGYQAGEVIGAALTMLMPERYRAAHSAGFARFLASGETRVIGETVELAGRRKDGGEFPLELSLASWKVGDRVHFTGLARDITRRRHAEEQVRKLNESLQQHAAELEAANQELEAFSYSVSHDLRAPLRAIDGFSREVLAGYAGQLDARAQDYLQRVRAASQRMGVLIDDILRLAKITRAGLYPEPVDLSSLAEQVCAELQQCEPDRQIDMQVAGDLRVTADPNLLRVAMENLLGNAVKFTRGKAHARIEFGRSAQDGVPVFFVRDNGAGFDMAYADKLFGAFQRLHGARDFEGTGIGLATVQRIIARHGGRIWAQARVGEGATFFFTLPD